MESTRGYDGAANKYATFWARFAKKLYRKLSSNFKEDKVQTSNSQDSAFPALYYFLGLCAMIIAVAVITLLVECKSAIKRVLRTTVRVFVRHFGNCACFLLGTGVSMLIIPGYRGVGGCRSWWVLG